MELRLGNIAFSIGRSRSDSRDTLREEARQQLDSYKSLTDPQVWFPVMNFQDYKSSEAIAKAYLKSSLISGCIARYQIAYPEPEKMVTVDNKRVENKAIEQLLRRPNPWQTESDLDRLSITYQLGTGNAYIVKTRANNGAFSEQYVFSDKNITPISRGGNFVDRYEFYNSKGIKTDEYPLEDVIHLPWIYPDPDYPFKGTPPSRLVADEWQTDKLLNKHVASVAKNYGVPPIVLQAEGLPPEAIQILLTMGMSDETVKQAIDRWQEHHTGDGAGKVGFVQPPFGAKVIGMMMKDMDLEGSRSTGEARVCSLHLIPPELVRFNVGLRQSTYENQGTARRSWTLDILKALWIQNGDKTSKGFQQEFGEEIEIEYDLNDVEVIKEMRREEVAKHSEALKGLREDLYKHGMPRQAIVEQAMYLIGWEKSEAERYFPEKPKEEPQQTTAPSIGPDGKLIQLPVNGNGKVGVSG